MPTRKVALRTRSDDLTVEFPAEELLDIWVVDESSDGPSPATRLFTTDNDEVSAFGGYLIENGVFDHEARTDDVTRLLEVTTFAFDSVFQFGPGDSPVVLIEVDMENGEVCVVFVGDFDGAPQRRQ
jgi:hypothetical protein